MKTVVGAFPSMIEAQRVARDLEEMGIDTDDISVIAGNESGKNNEYVKRPTTTGVAAASGASFGGGVGIVAGLIALAIPGVGPIIAGGALATVLTGLGVGAAAGGLIGAFINMGVSHEEAPLYEEAVRRGGVLVAVQVNDPMEGEALRVMDEHGARDLKADADVWRATGWKGTYYNPHPYPSDSSIVSHRQKTVTVDDVEADDTRSSDVQPVATPVSGTPSYVYDRPASSGEPYISNDDPAYVFGNRWASDPNYNRRSWRDVESRLRSNWEAMGQGPWDTYRNRIRRGFESGSEDPGAPAPPDAKPGQRGY